ncbi:PBP1A family penicillin-binding protein [bacterium]|nr:PBP1A family penicillin-binding protein [bacterium]
MAKRKRHLKVYQTSRWKKTVFLFLKFLGTLFLLGLFGILAIFVYYIKDLPRPEDFLEKKIYQSTEIYDRTGKVLLYTIHGEEKREIVSLSEISPFLQKAVIATEDSQFYQHRGIDIKGIIRSILVDLKLKKPVQGGSTITQQLIRNSFLSRQKTLERKLREIVLSLELEMKYSKEQILEWYLNQIPFGSNAYGAEAASKTFFNKSAKDLTLAESATLAALIKAPSYFSPYGEHKNELMKRKDQVLDTMAELGFITLEEAQKAKEEKLTFAKIIEPIKAPHFVLYVKKYLIEKYGEDFLNENGLKVYTTLDWDLQKKAEEIIADRVKINKNYKAYNAALVAINPKTGEILSMVGSADWFGEPYPKNCISGKNCLFDPKFNVAIGTKNNPGRQPGSAFKPFAYAAAFEKGFTPKTILWDVKTEFNPYCSPLANQLKDKYGIKCYHPQNYDGKFRGPMTAKNSLAQSINVTSVKMLYLAGIENTIELAKKMGITTLNQDPSQYGLSLVLGGGEVKLIDIVSAYGVFANEGLKLTPFAVLKIEDSQGNIIEEHKNTPKRVLETEVCRNINDILSDNKARTPMFGPKSALYFENKQVAAKTGTTQEYRDAWTIGYTPSIVVGVWAGNNDNTPSLKPGVVLAGPIFHKFMEEALKKFPSEEFKKPKEILTNKDVLNGKIGENGHCILYYVNKDKPQGEKPKNPATDIQYKNWEAGVKNWLISH